MIDGRPAKIVEVVGQDLGGQADGDAFGAFQEHNRELGGEGDGFLGATVIAQLLGRGLRIEQHVSGERGQACLDVTGCSRFVAGEHIAIIALRLDEEGTLADGNERSTNGGIAVRVKRHCPTDDVRYLVKAAVVHFP